MFEVSHYDSYSYLFNKPTFISLDPAAMPGSIAIKGMRIGVNGAEAAVGQAYAPLDTDGHGRQLHGRRPGSCSRIGTVIALEKGPDSDLFFLSFDQIGNSMHVRTPPAAPQPAPPADKPESSEHRRARVRARSTPRCPRSPACRTNDPNVKATYALVEQQLPTVATIEAFLASHQVGVAQLAIQYCNALVEIGSGVELLPGLQPQCGAGHGLRRHQRADRPAAGQGRGRQPRHAAG